MTEHIEIKTAKWDGAEMDYFCFGRGEETLVIIPGLSVQSVMGSANAVAGNNANAATTRRDSHALHIVSSL